METTTSTAQPIFIPVRDGIARLEADPSNKKAWYKKIVDGPARKVGLVILSLILTTAIVHYRAKGFDFDQGFGIRYTTSVPNNPSITITKGTWSPAVTIGDRQNIKVISVEPPVRRLVMINDNPNQVLPLTGLASDVDLGSDVKTLRWMLAQDEVVSSATITYELY